MNFVPNIYYGLKHLTMASGAKFMWKNHLYSLKEPIN